MALIKIKKAFSEKFKKILFAFLGLVFLVLAYFGILMPGVPAIPFILLSLFFFANSSVRLHSWMLNQGIIRRILNKLNSKNGKIGFKLFVISQLWVSIIVAELIFDLNHLLSILLIILGVIFSFITYILMGKY